MAEDVDWSDSELAATVAAYSQMLRLQNEGTPYNKTAFRRQLLAGPLKGRTDSAIEFRMQNISAVVQAAGRNWVKGYPPAKNVGPTNEARLRLLLADTVGVEIHNSSPELLGDVVSSGDQIMGVKAVFGALSSHVLCFGGRGDINDKSYFSVAAGAARRAVAQPFVVAIGGGKGVRDGLEGKVLNIARLSLIYGPTKTIVTTPLR